MNEFYNKKFFDLLEEIKRDYQLVYAKQLLDLQKRMQEAGPIKDRRLELLYKFPIEREIMKEIIMERLQRAQGRLILSEDELTEEQKVLTEKRSLIRSYMIENLIPDILFDEFYENYLKKYEGVEEKYLMSKSEVKKELQNVGFGVKVEYDLNDEPKKYIVFRFYNW